MPSSVKEHYSNLLAEHYDWMFGVPFEAKVAEQKLLLEELARTAAGGGLAVDLGCGSGFQSVALHELGYRVIAVDTCDKLLGDLAARGAAGGITTRQADLRELSSLVVPGTIDVAVCMGDTLTHLSSPSEVSSLFRSVARALKPDGRFVLTYRDLTEELQGLDRFIPVRGDERRVMTCFLEYESSETVVVHDLVNIRDADGHWALHKGSYRKLRLSRDWVCNELVGAGLSIITQRPGRLVAIAAAKPRDRGAEHDSEMLNGH
jgi:SAM-dependent methyltransferase